MTDAIKTKPARDQLLLRFRESDTRYGVTRETAKRLAEFLGVDETQAIHLALSEFAARNLPRYEPDDGPLSAQQIRSIRARVRPTSKRKVVADLFDPADA